MQRVVTLNILLFLLATGATNSIAQTNWAVRNVSLYGTAFRAITFAGREYIAVGDSGKIFASTDAKTWTLRHTAGIDLYDVDWNGKILLAVGGENAIVLSSPDGIEWTQHSPKGLTSGVGNRFTSVTSNDTIYVAAGFREGLGSPGGIIATSPDGFDWTIRLNENAYNQFYSVAWNGKVFRAVGGHTGSFETCMIYESSDGTTWGKKGEGSSDPFKCVIWNGTQFVMSSWDNIYPFSSDSGWSGCYKASNAIAYNGKTYVGVGITGMLAISTNGMSWTRRPSGTSANLFSVIWDGSRFLAVGENSTVITSSDGVQWSGGRPAGVLNGAAWDGSKFVIVGSDGFFTSPDGNLWTSVPTECWDADVAVCYANGLHVAAGYSGAMQISADGSVWQCQNSGTNAVLISMMYGNNRFIAAGDSGMILSSFNGREWTKCGSPTSERLQSVAYGNNQFVAVGGGVVLSSPDGEIWNSRISDTSVFFTGVAFGLNRFVATGRDSQDFSIAITSADGLRWSEKNWIARKQVSYRVSVVFGDTEFIAIQNEGFRTYNTPPPYGAKIYSSVDGVAWSPVFADTNFELINGAYGNDRFIAVGRNGAIVVSDADPVSIVRPVVPTKPARTDRRFEVTHAVALVMLPPEIKNAAAIAVYSPSGRLLYRSHQCPQDGTVAIPVRDFADGVYLISISGGEQSLVFPIIKK